MNHLEMKNYKATARILGFLFLLNLIPYVYAHMVILDNLLYAPDFLQSLSANRVKIGTAVLMEFLSITAMLSFAVLFFSVLRNYSNHLAVGYLGLRFVEFGIIVFSILKVLSLVDLSDMMAENENIDLIQVKFLGEVLLNDWEWIGIIYMLVYVLHCFIFFYLLFVSKLVPKSISIFGGLGTIMAFVNIVNHLFDLNFGGFFLFAPMGVIELVLAIYLIVYGFKKPSIT